MFDDQQPKNSGQVPPNLPIGEPEDIFAGAADDTSVPVDDGQAQEESTIPPAPASALEAGILRPRIQPVDAPSRPQQYAQSTPSTLYEPETRQQMSSQSASGPMQDQNTATKERFTVPPMSAEMGMPSVGDMNGGANTLKEPIGNRKTIMWIIILVIIGVLGVGSVWIYFSFIRPEVDDSGNFLPTTNNTTELEQNLAQPQNGNTNDTQVNTSAGTNDGNGGGTIDDRILFGEPIDTDSDGLDDVRESDLNTDPLNWDTDSDGLSDGDEVTVWKTDPLDSDSDNDGYGDGAEIKNGYSPTGPGKLFEPPTSTQGIAE